MESLMSDKQFNLAKDWFEDLRNQLINIVSEIDGKEFVQTNWSHRHEGGGTMSKIKGPVIEKGGVNISSVYGEFNSEMQNKYLELKKILNIKLQELVLFCILYHLKYHLCILILVF